MQQHHVKIKSIDKITHDVLQIITEKPPLFNFNPGQATEVSIKKNGKMKKDHSLFLAFLKIIFYSLPLKPILRIKV